MTHLLDTNPCIRYLNGQSETLRQRIDAAGRGRLAVCSVVKAELYFGSVKSAYGERTRALQDTFLSRFPSLPFDDRAAEVYSRIRAGLERDGAPIGANDLLIASIALANGLALISQNIAEFGRVPGLVVEDWEAARV